MGLISRLPDRGVGHLWPYRSRHRRSQDAREYQDLLHNGAPWLRPSFVQHFLGYQNALPADLKYTIVKTAGTPTSAALANVADGVWRGLADNTDEVQSVRADFGDQLIIPSNKRWIFQALIRVHTAITTAQRLAFGMQTAYNATWASVAEYVRFRLEANMHLQIEAYDGTNTFARYDTGQILVADDWHLFTINAWDPGNITFWMDELNLTPISASGGRASVNTLTALASTILFQPFAAVQKDSGTGVPSIDVDMIRVDWDSSHP